jgi:hypothetical protein
VCNDKKVGIDLKPSDLNPSSNPETIGNLIYGVGSPHDAWSPTDTDSKKTVEITLPDVNGVPAGEYPIMEVKLKPTGKLGPVTIKIFKDGILVFEDVYNSTPMKIRPTVPGTTIVLYFTEPANPVYDLQVFACVPEARVTTPAVTEIVTKPGTVPEAPTVPLVTGIETKPVTETQGPVKSTTPGKVSEGTAPQTTPGKVSKGTVPQTQPPEGTTKPRFEETLRGK